MKKEALAIHNKTYQTEALWPNRVVLTIKEAININHKVQSTLYSAQINLNLAIYHYFNATSRGHATVPERAVLQPRRSGFVAWSNSMVSPSPLQAARTCLSASCEVTGVDGRRVDVAGRVQRFRWQAGLPDL